MARGEFLTVFCYDVSNNRIRNKVAKHLEDHASRVQYSVFEARLTEQKSRAICQYIASMLDNGDSLRMYVIGKNGERRTRVFGDGTPIQNQQEYWLV